MWNWRISLTRGPWIKHLNRTKYMNNDSLLKMGSCFKRSDYTVLEKTQLIVNFVEKQNEITSINMWHIHVYTGVIYYSNTSNLCFCLFVWGIRDLFTHMEKPSQLRVRNCKFLPMLGTECHWAMWVPSGPRLLRHCASVFNGQLRYPVTLRPTTERFAV